MDRILEEIAKELDSDRASSATMSTAMLYVHLCRTFDLETPDWVRALANGNPRNIEEVITFARAEKASE